MTEKSYLTLPDMMAWIRLLAQTFEKEMDRLSALDGALGDGDHGTSMVRSFRAILTKMDAASPADIGELLMMVGSTMVSVSGGATGPLFGTIFMEAGKQARGEQQVDLMAIAAMMQASASAVMARGGAQPGDKTMVDALWPAAQALVTASAGEAALPAALAQAAAAAQEGAHATADMMASKGRARYLGERSLGHEDAGAHSVVLIFGALFAVAAG